MTATQAPRLFSVDDIVEITRGGHATLVPGDMAVTSVATDSRKVHDGGLFVALVGERTDGHAHVVEAVKRGARVLLVDATKTRSVLDQLRGASGTDDIAVIAVDDPLASLQELARSHMRRLSGVTRIGVTGSNGKTTTKELIGSILRVGSATAVNEGNLNSEIGLPVACFSVGAEHRYAVLEMGMNHVGEMDVLADIVRPDLALVTNVGTAHIGLLGTRENIALEKKKIFAHFSGGQTGFLHEAEDFAKLLWSGVQGKLVHFGPRSTRGYKGSESLGLDGSLIHWEGSRIRFPLFGPHNLSNALAAITVAQECGVPEAQVRDWLESVPPLFGRSQIIRGSVTVVFDSYNANPDSMDQALSFIQMLDWPSGRRWAVLGGMRELGAEGPQAHKALGKRLGGSSLDGVFLFGAEMSDAWEELSTSALASRSLWTTDIKELISALKGKLREGDLVLIKGSRGMELERLLPELKATFGETACS